MQSPDPVSVKVDIQRTKKMFAYLQLLLRLHRVISAQERNQETTQTLRDAMVSSHAATECCTKWIVQRDYGIIMKLTDVNGQAK